MPWGAATWKDSPVRRAISQLTVRVPESGPRKPAVWFYGSTAVGRVAASSIALPIHLARQA